MKIVSLIASATEIVCALGARDELVGRSHECDYPKSVEELPICSESKVDVNASAAEIDRQVKQVLSDALAVYKIKTDLLKELKPDVIVTQDQCDVCAVSFKDVEEAVCEMIDSNPEIVTLKPDSLKDFWEDIRRVAKALDRVEKGEFWIKHAKDHMTNISKEAQAVGESPRVACIEWFEPLMAGGNWMPELVEMLGAVNLFGEAGKHSPWMTWDDLVKEDPDMIITMPCGWDIERSKKEILVITDNPLWKGLKAVKEGQVYLTDGNQYFNRPGPRLVESLEILAEIIYPKCFNFGHKNIGWEIFQ